MNYSFMRLKYFPVLIILALISCKSTDSTEIDLSGSWNYCLVNSEKDYPPPATAEWRKVQLPNRGLFETIALKNGITKGYILYRKTVKINRKPPGQLVFQAGEIMNCDIVYINGKKIGRTGIFPPGFRSGWSKFRNYPVPDEILIEGENTVDIICYFDAELWFISPIRILDENHGNREYMFKNFIQIELIHALSILLLTFSLFFMMIFFKRRKEKMYFYYACTTFFLSDMTILQFMENIYTFLPLSSNTIYKICGVGPMFFPPFLALFFRSYAELKVTRRRTAVYLFLPFIFALLMIFSHDRFFIIKWRNIFLLIIPVYIADIIIVAIRQVMSGKRKGLLLFVTLAPVLCFGIYDILVFSLHIFEGTVPLYPIGVPFVVLLVGIQLINRFILNLNTSEELNILLEEKMGEGKKLAALENEITIARNIQLANVPHSLPEVQAFDIGVKYIPAENISGDFYNFHAFENEKLGVLIADVSGHGIPSSLIASMVKILFSTLKPVYSQPDLFIRGLNRYLHDKMEGNFLTAGYCYINRKEKKAIFSRAGHEPLYHISCDGSEAVLHEYKPLGIIIGLNNDIDPNLAEFSIDTGDRIVLYTDGLIEVINDTREIFGRERLKELLIQSKSLPVNETLEFILKSLREWNSSRPFDDDFTLVIIDIS